MFLNKRRRLVVSAMVVLSSTPVLAEDVSGATEAARPSAAQVLTQVYQCKQALQLRSVALTQAQQTQNCLELAQIEQRFMLLFQQPKPVLHDNNSMLRANIYKSQQQYAELAPSHFSMPTDNGGMYLEGLPHISGNQPEFVAYQRENGLVWNLGHEYVHYLDGRFNLAGDFCANLHDSHAAPENCPRPAPQSPYLVWWSEGMAEYVAHGDNNEAAIKLAASNAFKLSELFHTGYEINTGSDRVYRWGYLAVRYMFEKHQDKLKQMLAFTRNGDYPRCQALVSSWGQSMDEDFADWLIALSTPTAVSAKTTKSDGKQRGK